jgi:hypothetical protein
MGLRKYLNEMSQSTIPTKLKLFKTDDNICRTWVVDPIFLFLDSNLMKVKVPTQIK